MELEADAMEPKRNRAGFISVADRKHRSIVRKKQKGKKIVKCLKGEMGKLKANLKRMKAEGKKVKKELKDKKWELTVIKEEHRLVAEDNAGIHLCFDVIMLILPAEDADLVGAADDLSHSLRDLLA